MNRIISKIGAALVTITVFLFAVCLIIDFSFGSRKVLFAGIRFLFAGILVIGFVV